MILALFFLFLNTSIVTLFAGEAMSVLMFFSVITLVFLAATLFYKVVSNMFITEYKSLVQDRRTLSIIYLYVNAWWYYHNRLRFFFLLSIAWTLNRYLVKLNAAKDLVLDDSTAISLIKRTIDYNTNLYLDSVLKTIQATRRGTKPVRFSLREVSFFSITTSI